MTCSRCKADLGFDEGIKPNSLEILDKREKRIGLTSRGYVEEIWQTVQTYLKTEGHLEECIANFSRLKDFEIVNKLGLMLDMTRKLRQESVKLAFSEETRVDE